MRRLLLFVLRLLPILLLGAILTPSSAHARCEDAADSSCVTLRSSRYPINRYYICLVARFAYGERLFVEAGRSITGIIRERCGHADTDYQTIFQSIPENQTQREVAEDGEIKAVTSAWFVFPACLYARDYLAGNDERDPPTVAITRQMKLKEIAETYSGAGPDWLDRRIREIYNANQDIFTPGNAPTGNVKVSSGTKLKLPILIEPRSLKLDTGITSRAKFLTLVLKATQQNAFKRQGTCRVPDSFAIPLPKEVEPLSSTTTGSAETVASSPATTAGSAALATSNPLTTSRVVPTASNSPTAKVPPSRVETCTDRQVEPLPSMEADCAGEVSSRYPVDWSALKEILALEDVAPTNHERATVVLTDSGLLGIERANEQFVFPDALPRKVFLTIKPDKIGGNETVGINLSAEQAIDRYYPPFYFEDQPGKEHGTHIAGILLGQGEPANRALIEDRIKLFVLNVMTSDKGADAKCARPFYVKTDEVEKFESLNEIGTGFKIFIMSLETYSILQRPRNSDNTLVVAASGNAGMDYSSSDLEPPLVYPAQWRRKAHNVISVGGHDSTRARSVGNYGSNAVDILGPACKIRSLLDPRSATLRIGEMSGTSQATAFVTLGAALLHNVQPSYTSEEIKQRLLDAADYEPKLGDKSSAGLLNIPAALAARFAVLKMRADNKLRYGRISQDRVWGCWNSKPKEIIWGNAQVRRVSYELRDETPSRINVRWGNEIEQPPACSFTAKTAEAFKSQQLEFEEATIVPNNGQPYVAFRTTTVPLGDIREIVPQFSDAQAEGPTLE